MEQVVNDLISKPDMPPKGQIVNKIMNVVLLMANVERNLRRREALKLELHTSYCYLCAPSIPITTEIFRDDLPKAVKDVTDKKQITPKPSRETKPSFKRSRSDGHSDRYQGRYNSNYSYTCNYTKIQLPSLLQGGGGGGGGRRPFR